MQGGMERGAPETLGQPVLHRGIGGSPASAGGATTDHALRALVFWLLGQSPRGFTIYIVFFLELA